MTKPDLVQYMRASGEIHRFNIKDESWKRAIELYKIGTGGNVCTSCNGSITRVLEWLKK